MFRTLPAPAALEEEVLAFWDRERIFERSLEAGQGKKPWVFYEGPPTANGMPHNGHVLTRVIKDVFPRYRTMRGYLVDRKAGWDTHGLPVEVEVEKMLGIRGHEAILEYGLEKFSRACIDSVFVYVEEWERLTRQIGFWVDLPAAYVTFHRSYVESVWWALSELFKKGLLYQGHKVVWWWPQGGTALSAGEVGQGYKEVVDPAVTVRFRDADDPTVSYLAWTTTPWTLPSNVALAVGADVDYAYCDDPAGGEVVVAAALAEGLGLAPTRLVKGRDLIGRRYTPLFDFGAPEGGRGYVVVAGAHVTTDAGTGIVHTAPAFGEDDMKVAQQNGLGMLQWIAPNGKFKPGTGSLEGKFCKAADDEIILDLKARGFLFKREKIRHDYPFCVRADEDPLIQYARPAWFIRTTDKVKEALANNQEVSWLPDHIKDGRFGDFLRNNVDWALSRERFWGTPLNIWECASCAARTAPASTAEIKALNPTAFDPNVDEHLQVHKPWIDHVTLPCAACGGTMKRVPEVIDCWFDSGCMPFAQWGFPHQNVDVFRNSFPADFISEAIDQTRGWFYSLLMISTLLFDDETCRRYDLGAVGYPRPYKSCVVLGHVCDADGRKESKSKGNYTSPNLVLRGHTVLRAYPDPTLARGTVGMKADQVKSLDLASDERIRISADKAPAPDAPRFAVVAAKVGPKDSVHLHPDDLAMLGLPAGGADVGFAVPYDPPGADAFRWLFCSSSPVTSNTRLSLREIRDGQREFLIRLRNVYQFFGIYADIARKDGSFDPTAAPPRAGHQRGLLDRWILHRVDATVREVTSRMDQYALYEATQAVTSLVDDLSNWYVRRSRSRFWGEGADTVDALWTLYEVLRTTSRLIAPFVPFTAEALHRALTVDVGVAAEPSVHLESWPTPDDALRDDALAAEMALVRDVVSLGLAARSASRMKVRQPLRDVTVVLADPSGQATLERHDALMRDELNVREVRFSAQATEFVEYRIKPDFKKLGPKLGKGVKEAATLLEAMNGGELKAALDAGGVVLNLSSGEVTLTSDEVVVTVLKKEGFEAAANAAAVVALSTELDDDLRSEGLVRELTSRVQTMRKEQELGYTDRIRVTLELPEVLSAAVGRFGDYLARETLAVDVQIGAAGGPLLDVDGHDVRIRIERV